MSWTSTANRIATTASRVLGNAVTIGAVSGSGVLQMPREEVIGEAVVSIGYLLEVPAAVFSSVLDGQAVTVDGVSYVAREDGLPVGDGAMLQIPLTKL